MRANLPPPLVQTFMVCRQLSRTPDNQLALVCPLSGVTATVFPAVIPISAYAMLTEAHGRPTMGLQLVDEDGDVVWAADHDRAIEERDPLSAHGVSFADIKVMFPRVGRYDLVIVADGKPLARQALRAREFGRVGSPE